jgi:hypothetical protein
MRDLVDAALDRLQDEQGDTRPGLEDCVAVPTLGGTVLVCPQDDVAQDGDTVYPHGEAWISASADLATDPREVA